MTQPAFDAYVCEGDTIAFEKRGYALTARVEHDPDSHIDDDDMHNPDQAVTGCNDEQHKELLAARQAWLDDAWFYCGVVVEARLHGVLLGESSLWGIEANYMEEGNKYLTELALGDLADEAVAVAGTTVKKLCGGV